MIIEDRLGGGYTSHVDQFLVTDEKQNQTQDLFAVDNFFWQTLTGQTVFYNTQNQVASVQQKSEELKIVSPANQWVSWLAGLFYSDNAQRQ